MTTVMNSSEIKAVYDNSLISKMRFGFLGEAYFSSDIVECFDRDLINKYFSIKEPYLCSRNSHYYQTDVAVTIGYMIEYMDDIQSVLDASCDEDIRIQLLFTIVAHMLNDISKLIGCVFSHNKLRNKYIEQLVYDLQSCSDVFASLVLRGVLKKPTLSICDDLKPLLIEIERIGNIKLREYSEMDHPVILLQSFLVNMEYLNSIDMIVAPLQGASLVPVLYESFNRYLDIPILYPCEFEYIRYSNYDCGHHNDRTLEEIAFDISQKHDCKTKVLVIDDNTGTGGTLGKIKSTLDRYFEIVRTCALECRWDTKVNDDSYPSFEVKNIDIITPLEYRHYGYFDFWITYICSSDIICIEYFSGEFYNLEFAYDFMDFMRYIEAEDINQSRKNQIRDIVNNSTFPVENRA